MYFGSVRFFKNLILVAVIVMIALPTVFAISLKAENSRLTQKTEEPPESSDVSDTSEPEDPLEKAAPEYQKLHPDFRAPQTYAATNVADMTAYLTFDDGPSERTDEVLATLREKNVKATFFVVGTTNEDNLKRMKKIVAEGHTLGMHTYSHDYSKVYSSVEEYIEDMYKVFKLIRDTTGVTPTAFRFPGGSINGYNGGIYMELVAEMMRRGFVPYDWNVSAQDAASPVPSASKIQSTVLNGVGSRKRLIILFHDSAGHKTSAQALAPIIDALRNDGFTFAAITPDVAPTLFSYKIR